MLTQRENEVAKLVANGLSNSQIAETLCISLNTVRTYMKRIYYKYDLNQVEPSVMRVQLVLKYRKVDK